MQLQQEVSSSHKEKTDSERLWDLPKVTQDAKSYVCDFFFFFETGSPCVAQATLQHLSSAHTDVKFFLKSHIFFLSKTIFKNTR